MTQAQKRSRLAEIVERLKKIYPDAACALHWNGEPFRLLIMGSLSAQCTDARVNEVCDVLFSAYPTPEAIAKADISDLEAIREKGKQTKLTRANVSFGVADYHFDYEF